MFPNGLVETTTYRFTNPSHVFVFSRSAEVIFGGHVICDERCQPANKTRHRRHTQIPKLDSMGMEDLFTDLHLPLNLRKKNVGIIYSIHGAYIYYTYICDIWDIEPMGWLYVIPTSSVTGVAGCQGKVEGSKRSVPNSVDEGPPQIVGKLGGSTPISETWKEIQIHESIAVSGSLNDGKWYIITQLAVYTTYIPPIYCQLGDYISLTTY